MSDMQLTRREVLKYGGALAYFLNSPTALAEAAFSPKTIPANGYSTYDAHVHIRKKEEYKPGIEQESIENLLMANNNGSYSLIINGLGFGEIPKVGDDYQKYVLPGEEIKTLSAGGDNGLKSGHVIALGIEEPVKQFLRPYETIDRIAEQNKRLGTGQKVPVIIPHPCSKAVGLFNGKPDSVVLKFLDYASEKVSLYIESNNATSDLFDPSGPEKTKNLIGLYEAVFKESLNTTGGSDTKIWEGTIGACNTVFPKRIDDSADLHAYLAQGGNTCGSVAREMTWDVMLQSMIENPGNARINAVLGAKNYVKAFLGLQENPY